MIRRKPATSVTAANVSAVIVTRGDVPLDAILNSLPFDDVVVWNNAERGEDLKCYGRFKAIAECKHDTIYVQDDDILVPIPALLKAYDPSRGSIMANKKPDEEWLFLGVGALFPAPMAGCLDRYLELYPRDDDFFKAADVAFAYQQPYESRWLGYAEMEWSRAPNRMYLQPGHYEVRERVRARTLALPNRI